MSNSSIYFARCNLADLVSDFSHQTPWDCRLEPRNVALNSPDVNKEISFHLIDVDLQVHVVHLAADLSHKLSWRAFHRQLSGLGGSYLNNGRLSLSGRLSASVSPTECERPSDLSFINLSLNMYLVANFNA